VRHQAIKELRGFSGGARDTATVLRVFVKSAKGAEAPPDDGGTPSILGWRTERTAELWRCARFYCSRDGFAQIFHKNRRLCADMESDQDSMLTKTFNRTGGVRRSASFFIIGAFGLSLVGRVAMADMLRIPEGQAKKAIVSEVAPSIPPIARQLHLSGQVACDLTVSENGSVEKVDVVSGNPVLGAAAVAAGKKWTFKPFMVDGKASKALVRVSFNFGS
jgi:TonB family protein